MISNKIRRARQAGVPILAISCADQAAEVAGMAGNGSDGPVVCWDCIRGLTPVNEAGANLINEVCAGQDAAMVSGSFIECLRLASAMPANATLLMMSAHLAIKASGGGPEPGAIQAILNLRDQFKADGRVLVLLGPDWSLPVELRQSVIVIDEPLPERSVLCGIVAELVSGAGLPALSDADMEKAVDCLSGLSAFAAEQSVALSLRSNGIDYRALAERKRKQIEQTAGLRVMPANVNYSMVGGCAGFKNEMTAIMTGPKSPRVVVLVDEIEKAMAGVGTDTSGTSTDQLGVFLSAMSEKDWTGVILVGPPGASKSWLAYSLPGEFGCQGIVLDLGACKGSLVGESEAKIREAMSVIAAVGGSRVFFVATSNGIESLKPELRRRFSAGTWFADLATAEERRQVWSISLRRYGHEVSGTEVDSLVAVSDGWSAANIKDACFIASMKGVSPQQSLSSVIPAARMDPEGLDRLRRSAAGRYNSVAAGSVYSMVVGAGVSAGRRVQVGGGE